MWQLPAQPNASSPTPVLGYSTLPRDGRVEISHGDGEVVIRLLPSRPWQTAVSVVLLSAGALLVAGLLVWDVRKSIDDAYYVIDDALHLALMPVLFFGIVGVIVKSINDLSVTTLRVGRGELMLDARRGLKRRKQFWPRSHFEAVERSRTRVSLRESQNPKRRITVAWNRWPAETQLVAAELAAALQLPGIEGS